MANPHTFRKVSPRFWTGETGRQIRSLGHEVQVIAMYLLTCPSSDMSGLYYLSLPTLAHECGSSLEGASKGLQALQKLGFAHFDGASEQVFVVEMARIQIGEKLVLKDKKWLGIVNYLNSCKSPFLQMFYDKYQVPYKLPTRDFQAPTKPLPRDFSTKTEIETEIETETETIERAGAQEPPKPSRRAAAPKPKAERFVPDSFEPSEAHRAKAKELGVNVERELQSFRCHEFKIPKSDWNKAFHGWLLRASQFGTSSGGRSMVSKHDTQEVIAAEAEFRSMLFEDDVNLGKREPVKAVVVR